MDAKIRETAEKIYSRAATHNDCPVMGDDDEYLYDEEAAAHNYKLQAMSCVQAAKAFHALCNDDMMKVEK